MSLDKEAERLRIYIGEADTLQGRPRYEWIVEAARRHGLGGATVFRGVMGFGADSLIQTTDALRISGDLPIVIEIVDTTRMISTFLPEIDQLMDEGLVTREKVHVVLYRQSRSKPDGNGHG